MLSPHEVRDTTVYTVSNGKNFVWLADEDAPRSSLVFQSRQGGAPRGGAKALWDFQNNLHNVLGAGPPTVHDVGKAELEQVLTDNAELLGYVQ